MMSFSSHFFILFFLIATTGNKTENMWRRAGRLTGLLIQNCMQVSSEEPEEQLLVILQRCLKRRSLVALDNSLKADVIKLANGVELVRYTKDNRTQISRRLDFFQPTNTVLDWTKQILGRIAHVFETHSLKIRLDGYERLKNVVTEEGRGRKKHNMFMSLLMFGMAAVGLIMVPMGFQFLAVLGGKALLLAKMALILTAIQGLKKIAKSNLNYGLYATPEHGHCKDELCLYDPLEVGDSVYVAVDVDADGDGFWNYDRQWPYEAESHDAAPSHNNYYYQVPEQHPDLVYPFQRREDFKDMM